jgi:hypothetical protein
MGSSGWSQGGAKMLHKVIGRMLQDLVALLILSLIASTVSLLAAPARLGAGAAQ